MLSYIILGLILVALSPILFPLIIILIIFLAGIIMIIIGGIVYLIGSVIDIFKGEWNDNNNNIRRAFNMVDAHYIGIDIGFDMWGVYVSLWHHKNNIRYNCVKNI